MPSRDQVSKAIDNVIHVNNIDTSRLVGKTTEMVRAHLAVGQSLPQ